MNAYDTKTGLHGISSARRFVSQAMSSIEAMNVHLRPLLRRKSRILPTLDAALSPDVSAGMLQHGVHGTSGRPSQSGSRISPVAASVMPPSFKRDDRSEKRAMEMDEPSTPTVLPSAIFRFSHSQGSGVPSVSSFMRTYSVPLISSAACMKYLLSTHRSALSSVTITVPAEPVKPEMNALVRQRGATYSL